MPIFIFAFKLLVKLFIINEYFQTFFLVNFAGRLWRSLSQVCDFISSEWYRAGMLSFCLRSNLIFYLEKHEQVLTSRLGFDLCISALDLFSDVPNKRYKN
jgi:hypothetical protein